MIKITHIITGLGTGGAEIMLYRLLTKCDRSMFQPLVISLTDTGPIGKQIRSLNIPVNDIKMHRRFPNPSAFRRLFTIIRKTDPDIIQCWMYHANMIGVLVAQLAGGVPLVWGIHHSNLDLKYNNTITVFIAKMNSILSRRIPRKIICCSHAAFNSHASIGYDVSKMVVIPNGFDLKNYRPHPTSRTEVLRELGLTEDKVLVGLFGRFHPQKDHLNFIRAAGTLHATNPHVQFLLCGDGIVWANRELFKWIQYAGIKRNCHLLGRRADIPRLLAALDVFVLSSCGEGFPLVVGEAMSCGVPCVVTDVGDSAWIVGDTGRVVPPRDSSALASAVEDLILMNREQRIGLGALARQRIASLFSLPSIVGRYEKLYQEVASDKD